MFSTFFFFDFSLLILVQITLLNSNKVVIVFCGNDFETENERKKKIVRNDEYRFYAMYHWYVSLLRRWLLVVFFPSWRKKNQNVICWFERYLNIGTKKKKQLSSVKLPEEEREMEKTQSYTVVTLTNINANKANIIKHLRLFNCFWWYKEQQTKWEKVSFSCLHRLFGEKWSN